MLRDGGPRSVVMGYPGSGNYAAFRRALLASSTAVLWLQVVVEGHVQFSVSKKRSRSRPTC